MRHMALLAWWAFFSKTPVPRIFLQLFFHLACSVFSCLSVSSSVFWRGDGIVFVFLRLLLSSFVLSVLCCPPLCCWKKPWDTLMDHRSLQNPSPKHWEARNSCPKHWEARLRPSLISEGRNLLPNVSEGNSAHAKSCT